MMLFGCDSTTDDPSRSASDDHLESGETVGLADEQGPMESTSERDLDATGTTDGSSEVAPWDVDEPSETEATVRHPTRAPTLEVGDPRAIPGVRFVGRIDDTDPAGYRFAWSGSGFVARFEGTRASVELSDSDESQFTVVVDGVVQPPLLARRGAATYVLAHDLVAGTHEVEVYRRTEPVFGTTQFLAFSTDGTPLSPPEPERRIELIGDSISTAYGNEGESAACGFTADTQNHYLSYGALSARAIGAELHTLAWSGRGVIYNYGRNTTDPLPVLYERTLPDDPASQWDFSIIPDVVVINLGTNDFSTDGDPTPEVFETAYLALLDRIRSNYPDAFILCTVGIMLRRGDLAAARSGIANAVATFTSRGGDRIEVFELNVRNSNPGCDQHPGLAAHRAMAEVLTDRLRTIFDLL